VKFGWVVILTCILLVSFSCTTRKIVKPPTGITISEILSKVTERNEKIKSITGNGSVTFESPEISSSGYFTARMKKPDSLLFEVHGPFGIRVGTLSLTGRKYIYYDWLENKAISGNADEHTIMNLLRVPISTDAIFRVFSGEFLIKDSTATLVEQSSDNDTWHLIYKTADGQDKYKIDYESFIVTEFKRVDRDGKQIMSAVVSDIETVGDIYCGMVMRIMFPQSQQSVTVAYDDLSLNSPVTCTFTPPKKANIIYR
jgi:outer membrane lipoprotein-sorting protein